MLDFDNISLKNVETTINNIINDYKISTVYIIKTKNGYNAFSLTKKSFLEIVYMLSGYEYIDSLFIKLAVEKRGFFVLRMGKDKQYIKKIFSPFSPIDNSLSYAHYLFFKKIMDYPIQIGNFMVSKKYFDMLTKYKIISYKSVKHGFVNVKYDKEV